MRQDLFVQWPSGFKGPSLITIWGSFPSHYVSTNNGTSLFLSEKPQYTSSWPVSNISDLLKGLFFFHWAGYDESTKEKLDLRIHSNGSRVEYLARVRGGKGGFGSQLKGQRKGKKTQNFDACRDLNGRRIRNAKTVERLTEWLKDAKHKSNIVAALGGEGADVKSKVVAGNPTVLLETSYVQDMDMRASSLQNKVKTGMKCLADKKGEKVEFVERPLNIQPESLEIDLLDGEDFSNNSEHVTSVDYHHTHMEERKLEEQRGRSSGSDDEDSDEEERYLSLVCAGPKSYTKTIK